MDDALVHQLSSNYSNDKYWVLILVVMDDALVQQKLKMKLLASLNPCCNG